MSKIVDILNSEKWDLRGLKKYPARDGKWTNRLEEAWTSQWQRYQRRPRQSQVPSNGRRGVRSRLHVKTAMTDAVVGYGGGGGGGGGGVGERQMESGARSWGWLAEGPKANRTSRNSDALAICATANPTQFWVRNGGRPDRFDHVPHLWVTAGPYHQASQIDSNRSRLFAGAPLKLPLPLTRYMSLNWDGRFIWLCRTSEVSLNYACMILHDFFTENTGECWGVEGEGRVNKFENHWYTLSFI
jgi:hypothetical protein